MSENQEWPNDISIEISGLWHPRRGPQVEWRVIAVDTDKNSVTLQLDLMPNYYWIGTVQQLLVDFRRVGKGDTVHDESDGNIRDKEEDGDDGLDEFGQARDA